MRFWCPLIALCFALSGCELEPYGEDDIQTTILPPLPTKPVQRSQPILYANLPKQAPQAEDEKTHMVQKKPTPQQITPSNNGQSLTNYIDTFFAAIFAPQNTQPSPIEKAQTQIADEQENNQTPQRKNDTKNKTTNLEDNKSSRPESSLQQQSAQIANIIAARHYNRNSTEAPAAQTNADKADQKKSPARVISFSKTDNGTTTQTKVRRMTLRELTANLVTYATYHLNPRGNTLYDRSQQVKWSSNLESCIRMGTETAAQLAFLKAGGPIKDPKNLDPDGDGYACGWDPQSLRFNDVQ